MEEHKKRYISIINKIMKRVSKSSVTSNKNKVAYSNNVFIALIIALVGLFIVLTPVLVQNKSVVAFASDKFNMITLVCIALVLFFVDIRIGVVFTILLLSVLSYGYYHNENFMMPEMDNTVQGIASMPNMLGEDTMKLDDYYKPQSNDLEIAPVMPKNVETFTNDCDIADTDKLPSEAFVAAVEGASEEDIIVSPALPLSNDNVLPVEEYMKRLQDDMTKKLVEGNASYDVVSCRYDMTDAAQNTTMNGPPLGWNNTYGNKSVNGQLFYPMHG